MPWDAVGCRGMRWVAVGCGGMRWEKYAVENVHIGVVGASTNRVVCAGDPKRIHHRLVVQLTKMW